MATCTRTLITQIAATVIVMIVKMRGAADLSVEMGKVMVMPAMPPAAWGRKKQLRTPAIQVR